MKIYAKSREFNKQKMIKSLIGKDLWTEVIVLGEPYFARFIKCIGREVKYNLVSEYKLHDVLDNPTRARVSALQKELRLIDLIHTDYVDWITFMPATETYTTSELFEFAGMDGEE